MEYGLIGEFLTHSFSREIHEKIAPYSYELCELSREQLPSFLEKRDFRAINVTIPYKRDVIPYLSYIDDFAKKIGAVNTIVNRDGKLYGYNTDFVGMKELILRNGWSLLGRRVLILGTGGTSRTAKAVCESLLAEKIAVAGRASGETSISYEEAYRDCSDFEYIINTTPCGMYPYPDGNDETNALPIDISKFSNLMGIIDTVYNPLRTNFIMQGKKRGISAEGGLYMLVSQAIAAAEYFTGIEKSQEEKNAIMREIEAEKENIVLIGMAGCGKTTIGAKLAKRTGRIFIDTDKEIIKRTKMSVVQIFAECGEEGFRKIEREVIREISGKYTGAVIATGGGSVLCEENVLDLKRNGRLYFLNRPVEDIRPIKKRPLFSDRETFLELYNKRYDIYINSMDCEITEFSSIYATINAIRKDFFNESDGD